jgi:hypothetical protein
MRTDMKTTKNKLERDDQVIVAYFKTRQQLQVP